MGRKESFFTKRKENSPIGLGNDPRFSSLEDQFQALVEAFKEAGVLSQLPRSGKLGVIGLAGEELPSPDFEGFKELLWQNQELVRMKMEQGFTELLLTPIGISISAYLEIVKSRIILHAREGNIFRTKRNKEDPDVPSKVNIKDPIWVWKRLEEVFDTPKIVYFPGKYSKIGHGGKTKEELIQDKAICPFRGWSIGLIEPLSFIPPQGMEREISGRKQLGEGETPWEYLETLLMGPYFGETGWVLEDFLSYFLVKLELTSQVSWDRFDGNGLWLIGNYLPELMPRAQVVPVAFWDSLTGKLRIAGHRTKNKIKGWGTRTIVRLEKRV